MYKLRYVKYYFLLILLFPLCSCTNITLYEETWPKLIVNICPDLSGKYENASFNKIVERELLMAHEKRGFLSTLIRYAYVEDAEDVITHVELIQNDDNSLNLKLWENNKLLYKGYAFGKKTMKCNKGLYELYNESDVALLESSALITGYGSGSFYFGKAKDGSLYIEKSESAMGTGMIVIPIMAYEKQRFLFKNIGRDKVVK